MIIKKINLFEIFQNKNSGVNIINLKVFEFKCSKIRIIPIEEKIEFDI